MSAEHTHRCRLSVIASPEAFARKGKTMHIRCRLTGLLIAAIAVLLTGIVAGAQPSVNTQDPIKAVTAGPFKVGQKWVYDHEGPRPGAMEPNAINGQRVLQIVSRTEQEGKTLWVIEERFTRDPNVVGRLYVDDTRLLRSLDIANAKGDVARLTYESAIAYQAMDMEVGEQKTLKTKLVTADGKFTIPTTVEVNRLGNETVVTGAGRFEACRHFEVVTTSVINLKLAKIPMKETRQRWYSDQVNGLVKEVYEKDPGKFLMWSWKGYTAVSTLVSFSEEDVDVHVLDATETAAADSGQSRNHGADRPMMPLTWRVVLGLLIVGICLFGGVLLARRLK
jgi:hypothetical protein